MTIDLYIPLECVWYSLIALYLIGYVICARKIYRNFLVNPDELTDRLLSGWISIFCSVLWPAGFAASIMFYGIAEKKKNENN